MNIENHNFKQLIMSDTKAELEEPAPVWRLEKLEIKFRPGYSFNKTVDRYEGNISFNNKQQESFTLNLRPEMVKEYMNLISKEIVTTAESLSSHLVESLGLVKS